MKRRGKGDLRLLHLDIETAPNVVYAWRLYNQFIPVEHVVAPGYTLCWAAKWHGQKAVMWGKLVGPGREDRLDEIHALMSAADAICTWNGVSFDVPTLHKEFLLAGLAPPAPSLQMDLLKTSRRKFKLASNKLDFVAQSLGLGKKVKHKGMELWTKCMAGDPVAWATMERYNKQDVVLLEKVYNRLVPWVERHPNVGGGPEACPKCGARRAQRRGEAVTRTRRYARFQCGGCGAWFRSVLSEKGSAVGVVEI